MRRDEAEAEAARLNETDERAGALEFYAMDASAGMTDDAWEVATRLRSGDAPPRRRRAPEPPPAPEPVRDPEATQAYAVEPAWEEEPAGEEPVPTAVHDEEAWPEEAPAPGERRLPRRMAIPRARRSRDPSTPGIFTRFIGILVIIMALVWTGTTVALILLLGASSLAAVGIYVVALLLGLFALFLGRAILRS